MILAAILGLALLTGAVSAGYWYGTDSAKLESQILEPQLETQVKMEPTPSVKFTYEPPLPPEANPLSIKKVSDYRGDLIQAPYEISAEESKDYYQRFFRDLLNENGWEGIGEGASTVWDMGAIKNSVEIRVTVDYSNGRLIVEEFL